MTTVNKSDVFLIRREAKYIKDAIPGGTIPFANYYHHCETRKTFLQLRGPLHKNNYEVQRPIDVKIKDSKRLTKHELKEISRYRHIYYYGQHAFFKRLRYYNHKDGVYVMSLFDHISYRYEIWRFIGAGGFCLVVEAYDHKNKEFVAIKMLKRKRNCFYSVEKEVAMLRLLKRNSATDADYSDLFVQYKSNFTFRGFSFIVMEKLGPDLQQVLAKNLQEGIGTDLVRRFSCQLVHCLCKLEKLNIAHCDLKPDNLLLKKGQASIKMNDFGLSTFYSDLTRVNAVQNKYYTSPESLLFGPITPAMDMWCVGVIICEMYTGKKLFFGENEFDQLTLMIELLGVPPLQMLGECYQRVVDRYFYAHRVPRYCHYVEDGFGGMTLISSPSPSGAHRGLPGTRTLREALNNCQDETFLDFISRCLDWNPRTRITPRQAIRHVFLRKRFTITPIGSAFTFPVLAHRLWLLDENNSNANDKRHFKTTNFLTCPY